MVKVLKPYKNARDDFLLELNIVTSIKHKHITPLIGVCMESEHLISVYDYFHEGSLEENLHGEFLRLASFLFHIFEIAFYLL